MNKGLTPDELANTVIFPPHLENFKPLKAEQALDVKMTVGFRFPDVNESFGLEVRRGIAQFHPQMPEPTDAVIAMNKSILNRILFGQINLPMP